MTTVVEAVDLRRTYKTTTGTFRRGSVEVEAVRGISFEIQEGELLASGGTAREDDDDQDVIAPDPDLGHARINRARRRPG